MPERDEEGRDAYGDAGGLGPPEVAARLARGDGGPAGLGHLHGVPRVGRCLGQARAADLGRGPRHRRTSALAGGGDPGAAAPGEAAAAALDHRGADAGHRPSRRVDRPAAGRGLRPRDRGPGVPPRATAGRPGRRAGLRVDPRLLGPLRRRDATGGQRRAAGVLHRDGALCRLARPRRRGDGRRSIGAHRRDLAAAVLRSARAGVPLQGPDRPDADIRRDHPLPDPGRPAAHRACDGWSTRRAC